MANLELTDRTYFTVVINTIFPLLRVFLYTCMSIYIILFKQRLCLLFPSFLIILFKGPCQSIHIGNKT